MDGLTEKPLTEGPTRHHPKDYTKTKKPTLPPPSPKGDTTCQL